MIKKLQPTFKAPRSMFITRYGYAHDRRRRCALRRRLWLFYGFAATFGAGLLFYIAVYFAFTHF